MLGYFRGGDREGLAGMARWRRRRFALRGHRTLRGVSSIVFLAAAGVGAWGRVEARGNLGMAVPAFAVESAAKQDTQREAKRSEEHTSELQSRGHLVCRLLLEKKKKKDKIKNGQRTTDDS